MFKNLIGRKNYQELKAQLFVIQAPSLCSSRFCISFRRSASKFTLARSDPSLPSSFLPSKRVPDNLNDCNQEISPTKKFSSVSPLQQLIHLSWALEWRFISLAFFFLNQRWDGGFGAQDRCFAAVGPGAWHVPFYKQIGEVFIKLAMSKSKLDFRVGNVLTSLSCCLRVFTDKCPSEYLKNCSDASICFLVKSCGDVRYCPLRRHESVEEDGSVCLHLQLNALMGCVPFLQFFF